MRNHVQSFQVFVVKEGITNTRTTCTDLQSIIQHYAAAPHMSQVPGGKDEFQTYDEAEIWIDRHGERNLTFTILPIYRPKPH